MQRALTTLIDRLDSPAVLGTNVIKWGCPVPSFGDLSKSKVATLGLNPSNREFVDEAGHELHGILRRFHTLKSLGLESWADTDASHLDLIMEACRNYFGGNPYDRWFRKLDRVVAGARASFYDSSCMASHLDLIPYATECKWTELTGSQRTQLIDVAGDTLGLILRESAVNVLILNGASVVKEFENISGEELERQEMHNWTLPRKSGPDVQGFAFNGNITNVGGTNLGRSILILGYNHNLQSSFGVTNKVIQSIHDWIATYTI